jgi:PAS domain S-box-containing protein
MAVSDLTRGLRRANLFLLVTGLAAALAGAVTMLSWHAHWSLLLQGVPGGVAMKYNTALCFILCGAGAAALTGRHFRWAVGLGGVVALVAVCTLLEYVLGAHGFLDELFIKDYLLAGTVDPGRMSALTAACFILLAIGLMSAGYAGRRLKLLALTCTAVVLITAAAMTGHLVGINSAFGWGVYTRMAVSTGLVFFALASALMGWAWCTGWLQGIDPVRWLPGTAAVTIMGLVALGSSISQAQLENGVNWDKHSYEVLLTAQALLGHLQDVQRGMRRYALSDQEEGVQTVRAAAHEAPRTLAELEQLTLDNPDQQARIKVLTADVREVLTYADRLIATHDHLGKAAAGRLDNEGDGRRTMDRARADIDAFSSTERALLTERNGFTQRNFRNTGRLTTTASLLATTLLVLALFLSDRELMGRRRADARLAQSLRLQTEIVNYAHYGIVSARLDGTVTSFNAAAERMLGYSAAEVVGRATAALWHDPTELEAHAREKSAGPGGSMSESAGPFAAAALPGQSDEDEWTFIRKDGSRFRGSLVVTALTDAGAEVSGYLGIMADVTERLQKEAELRLSEDRFRRAFDDAPIGMALGNPQGKCIKVNRSLCRMLGYSAQELLATDTQAYTHPADREASAAYMRRTLAGEIPGYEFEKRYLHKNGTVIFVNLSVFLARDVEGRPQYFISQVENITHRHEMDRMKREFISTVSHELRTPLTSIRGSLGLLAAGVLGDLSEKAGSMVKIAHQNSERLVRIINDILDIEKIEAGKLELHCERVALRPLLEQAVAVNQGYADKYQVRLVLDSASVGDAVVADADRLMQVMANLLSNATKFSASGAVVSVRASREGELMRVEVEDRGSGIPEEFRGRVFEKFAQADGSSSRRADGTGLGLSIARQLVEAMGGSIGFHTEMGRGTTFFIQLRCAPQESPGCSATRALSATARYRVLICADDAHDVDEAKETPRVLHVEDDVDLLRVLQSALADRAELVTAATLEEARRRLLEESFSLVLLDVKLPDGDGLTLLDRLPLADRASAPPVVILSAGEVSQEVQRRVAATLVKSRVSEFRIVETILSLVRSNTGSDSEGSRDAAVAG